MLPSVCVASIVVLATALNAAGQETLYVAKPFLELKKPAQFFHASQLVPDASGNIYVGGWNGAEGTSFAIGKITPQAKTGSFTTTIGKGFTSNGLAGAVVDKQGYLCTIVFPKGASGNPTLVRVNLKKPAEIIPIKLKPNIAFMHTLAMAPSGNLYVAGGVGIDELWRVDPKGNATKLAGNLGFGLSGMEISPDEKNLYIAERFVGGKIWALAVKKDGSLEKKRLLKGFKEDILTQLCCDAVGNLYVTRTVSEKGNPFKGEAAGGDYKGGSVVILAPTGEQVREIDVLGPSAWGLCFGGADGKTVYVSTFVKGTGPQRIAQFRVEEPGMNWKYLQQK